MSGRRLALLVAACAVVVHLGALANRFAMDDIYIIVLNPLVQAPAPPWDVFASPYWPPNFGGQLYRPLAVLTYTFDRLIASPTWFHLVNLGWHGAASALVALLVAAWAGSAAGLVAGLLFAVHPVHVEAVANVIGRAELMAAAFTCVAVWAALDVRRSPAWSAVALALGLLSKENAAVAPALVAWAWLLGVGRPDRRRATVLAGGWLLVGVGYAVARTMVLAPYGRLEGLAPVFVGLGPGDIRLTAVAALSDVARLLLFPLTLRADYSPAERTAVTDILDPRLAAGVLVTILVVGLIAAAWRRGRRIEALGLGWAVIAYAPVSNLIVPIGVLVAERTLYLPSAGVVVAVAVWAVGALPRRVLIAGTAALVAAGAARSAWRVPVWRDDATLTESILADSPRSYRGPARAGGLFQSAGRPERALAAYLRAGAIYDRDAQVWLGAADAALTLGRRAQADSLLARADAACERCAGFYRFQAAAARARGDTATARVLLDHAASWGAR